MHFIRRQGWWSISHIPCSSKSGRSTGSEWPLTHPFYRVGKNGNYVGGPGPCDISQIQLENDFAVIEIGPSTVVISIKFTVRLGLLWTSRGWKVSKKMTLCCKATHFIVTFIWLGAQQAGETNVNMSTFVFAAYCNLSKFVKWFLKIVLINLRSYTCNSVNYCCGTFSCHITNVS